MRGICFVVMLSLGLGGGLPACGPDSNLNAFLFVDDEDESLRFDAVFAKARSQFDEGNFPAAQRSAEKAYDLNPRSQQAAQLLGFVYLARAGVDMINLISSMSSTTSSASGGGIGVLSDLGVMLNLTPSDYAAMGTLDNSNNSFYTALPVYLPKTPGVHTNDSDPRGAVATLKYVNRAIAIICPFIDKDLIADFDHQRYQCERPAGTPAADAQSYLLFSMAHLTETLAFNSLLTYSSEGASLQLAEATNTNLLKRANALNGQSVGLEKMGDYADAVVTIKDHIREVFDAAPGSMLYETLLDLRIVVRSLKKIVGMPDKVIAKLEAALSSIEDTAKKAGATGDSLGEQSQGFRQELNKKIVDKVNTNVGDLLERIEGRPLSNDQIKSAEKMCGAADSLVKESGVAAPEKCDGYRRPT